MLSVVICIYLKLIIEFMGACVFCYFVANLIVNGPSYFFGIDKDEENK